MRRTRIMRVAMPLRSMQVVMQVAMRVADAYYAPWGFPKNGPMLSIALSEKRAFMRTAPHW